MDKDFISVFMFVTSLKFLFIPTYHSTDFEVHRNWMAITYNKNITNWYQEDTSQWTLDYPPFFAWFEYGLSEIAKFFDARMLSIKNLDYASPQTIFFMRLSVILSDLVFVFAIRRIFSILQLKKKSYSRDPWFKPEVIFAMLMLWSPALLLVDHIHFQYNGFLNGFLFLSISAMLKENYLESALWYTVLLNFKHIYLYFAPAYFVFLLRNYCFRKTRPGQNVTWKDFAPGKFLTLAVTCMSICAVSFAPFVQAGQLEQVLRRIFPVKRGLTHAYWAPNVWALYNFADRCLVIAARFVTNSKSYGATNATKGLVQEFEHVVLPSVNIQATILLTLLAFSPFVWVLWKNPRNPYIFLHGLVGCAFASFLFGYHVHEKAIMMITLPFTLIAVVEPSMSSTYILLSAFGHFGLFPLLHESGETPIKIILVILHGVYTYRSLVKLHWSKSRDKDMFTMFEFWLLNGIFVLQILSSFGHLALGQKLPFLTLMVTSTYCAMGIVYCCIKYYSILYTQLYKKISVPTL